MKKICFIYCLIAMGAGLNCADKAPSTSDNIYDSESKWIELSTKKVDTCDWCQITETKKGIVLGLSHSTDAIECISGECSFISLLDKINRRGSVVGFSYDSKLDQMLALVLVGAEGDSSLELVLGELVSGQLTCIQLEIQKEMPVSDGKKVRFEESGKLDFFLNQYKKDGKIFPHSDHEYDVFFWVGMVPVLHRITSKSQETVFLAPRFDGALYPHPSLFLEMEVFSETENQYVVSIDMQQEWIPFMSSLYGREIFKSVFVTIRKKDMGFSLIWYREKPVRTKYISPYFLYVSDNVIIVDTLEPKEGFPQQYSCKHEKISIIHDAKRYGNDIFVAGETGIQQAKTGSLFGTSAGMMMHIMLDKKHSDTYSITGTRRNVFSHVFFANDQITMIFYQDAPMTHDKNRQAQMSWYVFQNK